MSHEKIRKVTARRDEYADMIESGFREKGLPPYAYSPLCRDPDYAPGGKHYKRAMKRRKRKKP